MFRCVLVFGGLPVVGICLMLVVRYALCVVCCLLFVDECGLSVIDRWCLLVVGCCLFVECCVLFVVCCLWFCRFVVCV